MHVCKCVEPKYPCMHYHMCMLEDLCLHSWPRPLTYDTTSSSTLHTQYRVLWNATTYERSIFRWHPQLPHPQHLFPHYPHLQLQVCLCPRRLIARAQVGA